MAQFNVTGAGATLFTAFNQSASPRPFAGNLLYINANEFGIANADGSTTYVKGSGFVWDSVNKAFTAGTVKTLSHYSSGLFHDDLVNISGVSAAELQDLFEELTASNSSVIAEALLAGDDLLDGRGLVNGLPVARTLDGEAGNDLVRGGGAGDTLLGNTGHDTLYGNSGDDDLFGGTGNDTLRGGAGGDTLHGDDGIDVLIGAKDEDNLAGGSGTDTLRGGGSNDRINGGLGDDELKGGGGEDVFEFTGFASGGSNASNDDVILDFRVGRDVLSFINVDEDSLDLTANGNGDAVVEWHDGVRFQEITLSGMEANGLDLGDLLA